MAAFQKKDGFTLLELLVVIGIIAIGAAAAVPSFIETVKEYRLRSATRQVFSTLQQAKMMAIKEHVDVLVDRPTASSCRLFVDRDGDAAFSAGDTLIKTIDLSKDKLTVTGPFPLGFNNRGAAANGVTGTIVVRKDAARAKNVTVNVTGNIRVL